MNYRFLNIKIAKTMFGKHLSNVVCGVDYVQKMVLATSFLEWQVGIWVLGWSLPTRRKGSKILFFFLLNIKCNITNKSSFTTRLTRSYLHREAKNKDINTYFSIFLLLDKITMSLLFQSFWNCTLRICRPWIVSLLRYSFVPIMAKGSTFLHKPSFNKIAS